MILEIFIGFILGLIGTWIFWKYQINIKPKLKISDVIALTKSLKKDNKKNYRIKMVNLSNRNIINIKVRLTVVQLKDILDGKTSIGIKHIKDTEISVIGARKNVGNPWGLSPIRWISFDYDPEICTLLKQPETRIMLTVSATDAISGTTAILRKTFKDNDVKKGEFKYGLTLEILEKHKIT